MRKKDSVTAGGAGYCRNIVAQQALRVADVMRDEQEINAEVEEEEGAARKTALMPQ